MAPPLQPPSKLGRVDSSDSSRHRVQVQFGKGKQNKVNGPWQLTRELADMDLKEAQSCRTREDMKICLQGLTRREADASASSADGRLCNRGRLGNRGNTKGRTGKLFVPRKKTAATKKRNILSKFQHKTYKLAGLDLRMARMAAELHKWPDHGTVVSLIKVLEEGGGGMDVHTHHFRKSLLGRLWLTYPAPLHVNRQFRATLFWPQKELYTDVDMHAAHNHIAIYLAGTRDRRVTAIPDYVEHREDKHAELAGQGVESQQVKQLWVSLLNAGTLAGWKRKVLQTGGRSDISINSALRKHLQEFRKEAVSLRNSLLHTPEWKHVYAQVAEEFPRKNQCRKPVVEERLCRRAWSIILGSLESQLMRELEDIIPESSPGAHVCMPSYDGLLVHHREPLKMAEVEGAWGQHCQQKYGYEFPLKVKGFDKDLPKWAEKLHQMLNSHR